MFITANVYHNGYKRMYFIRNIYFRSIGYCSNFLLNRSQTCPQCRKDCKNDQLKQIYIDFVSDEDLACKNAAETNTDNEDTIKLLLEHIDTFKECEGCKVLQIALNNSQSESVRKECENCKVLQKIDKDRLTNDLELLIKGVEGIEIANKTLTQCVEQMGASNLLKEVEQLQSLAAKLKASSLNQTSTGQ